MKTCCACHWLLGTFCGLFKREALPVARGCLALNRWPFPGTPLGGPVRVLDFERVWKGGS